MRFAILGILAATFAQEDTGEQFFKFPVGTSWKLVQKEGEKETRIELKVLKHEEGKTHVESKEFKGEGEPRLTTLLWWAEGGHVIWGEKQARDGRNEFHIYKLGSKKGDSWDAGAPPGAKATNQGTVEKKVAAGTYKDALQIQLEFGGLKMDMFLAPKVGLLGMEMTVEGKTTQSVELTEFKEGK